MPGQGFYLRHVTDIGRNRENIDTDRTGGTHLFRCLFKGRTGQIGKNDAQSCLGEAGGSGQSDAAGSTGNDGNPAF